MRTYLIADTHFNHANILKYENRPFKDVEEMNKMLIQNWNNKVSKNDKVFMLGDFCFSSKENTLKFSQALNGYKILILGNHDKAHSVNWWKSLGTFEEVIRYPIIIDDYYILSHEPIYINDRMPFANIFGHVHNNGMYNDCSKQSFCVSVERINYTPIRFDIVKEKMQASPI